MCTHLKWFLLSLITASYPIPCLSVKSLHHFCCRGLQALDSLGRMCPSAAGGATRPFALHFEHCLLVYLADNIPTRCLHWSVPVHTDKQQWPLGSGVGYHWRLLPRRFVLQCWLHHSSLHSPSVLMLHHQEIRCALHIDVKCVLISQIDCFYNFTS